jgi:hypothetical protein
MACGASKILSSFWSDTNVSLLWSLSSNRKAGSINISCLAARGGPALSYGRDTSLSHWVSAAFPPDGLALDVWEDGSFQDCFLVQGLRRS